MSKDNPIYFYQSLWKNSESCAGPPDSLYLFNADESQRLPKFLDYLSENAASIDICGFCPVSLSSGCCWVTYEPNETAGYVSTMFNLPASTNQEDLDVWTPTSAVESSYCLLQYQGNAGNISRYILDSVQSHGNTGMNISQASPTCYEEAITCIDGTLTIYSNTSSSCTGDIQEVYTKEDYNIPQTSAYYNTPLTVSKYTVTAGSQKTLWQAYVPQTQNVIHLNTPGRQIAGVGMLIGALVSVFGLIWTFRRLSRTRTRINLWLGFIQLLSFSETVVLFTWLYIPQTSEESYLLYYQFAPLMQSIVTLSLALMNVQFVITIIPLKMWDATWQKYLIYTAVCLVHFAMAWPNWIGYLVPSDTFLFTWDTTGFPIWAFVSIGSCVASILFLVAYKTKKLMTKAKKKMDFENIRAFLWNRTPSTGLLAILSIFDFCAFTVFNAIEWYTPLAGNDNDQQIIQFYAWIPFPIQGLLTIWFLEIAQGYITEHGKRVQKQHGKHPPSLNHFLKLRSPVMQSPRDFAKKMMSRTMLTLGSSSPQLPTSSPMSSPVFPAGPRKTAPGHDLPPGHDLEIPAPAAPPKTASAPYDKPTSPDPVSYHNPDESKVHVHLLPRKENLPEHFGSRDTELL